MLRSNIKIIIVIISLFVATTPIFADVINPNLTPAQREILRQERHKAYLYRKRLGYIQNICGDILTVGQKECKAKLKNEYEENLKFLNQYIKDNHKDAEKSLKNASK